MFTSYKKIDLFGKLFLQKMAFKGPTLYEFPVEDRACFLYTLDGGVQYKYHDTEREIPPQHSLLLNCLEAGKKVEATRNSDTGEIVIVTFHPDVLKKIYGTELPAIVQAGSIVSNQFASTINNDFLIQKYIEGLLFYFENPSLLSDEILILKLKEVILLLSQTREAKTVQVILSQLFSPAKFTFKQIIEANIFSQINIEELAAKTNLSVSSFKREFKRIYDTSPASYIKTSRLQRASELLLVSGQRISDIAFECGFNDLAGFTKSFHDMFGVTPTNYRLHQIVKK